jgi:hypothetical protein
MIILKKRETHVFFCVVSKITPHFQALIFSFLPLMNPNPYQHMIPPGYYYPTAGPASYYQPMPYAMADPYQSWSQYYWQQQAQQQVVPAPIAPNYPLHNQIYASKVEKVPVNPPAPAEVEYFCEPCEKTFKTTASYEAHLKSHEACKHPGCNFNASKKVVIAHFHSSHGQYNGSGYKTIDVEGQKFRVLLGTSPEEVEQWRAERKSKFPTEKRAQLLKDKISTNEGAGGITGAKRQRKNTKGKEEEKEKESENALTKLAEEYQSDSEENAKQPSDVQTREKGQQRKKQRTTNSQRLIEPKIKDNLLQNLLNATLAQEDNIVLQCIRYSIVSRFFQQE